MTASRQPDPQAGTAEAGDAMVVHAAIVSELKVLRRLAAADRAVAAEAAVPRWPVVLSSASGLNFSNARRLSAMTTPVKRLP